MAARSPATSFASHARTSASTAASSSFDTPDGSPTPAFASASASWLPRSADGRAASTAMITTPPLSGARRPIRRRRNNNYPAFSLDAQPLGLGEDQIAHDVRLANTEAELLRHFRHDAVQQPRDGLVHGDRRG